jgi:hypothetical protein
MCKGNSRCHKLHLGKSYQCLDEKWSYRLKIICFWSMTDFFACCPPTIHRGVSVILADDADPVTFRSPEHRKGTCAGVIQSIIGDLWPQWGKERKQYEDKPGLLWTQCWVILEGKSTPRKTILQTKQNWFVFGAVKQWPKHLGNNNVLMIIIANIYWGQICQRL